MVESGEKLTKNSSQLHPLIDFMVSIMACYKESEMKKKWSEEVGGQILRKKKWSEDAFFQEKVLPPLHDQPR